MANLLVVVSIAFTAGCSRAMPQPSPVARVLTEADSGGSLSLAVGATFEVQLPSRPGTGFTWELARTDPAVVAQAGPSSSQPVGPPRPGSAAVETIPFVARGVGATRLEIAYHRPWERGAPPARTFVVDVTVR